MSGDVLVNRSPSVCTIEEDKVVNNLAISEDFFKVFLVFFPLSILLPLSFSC